MAIGTVADERRERKRELDEAKEELAAAMGRYAAAELAAAAGKAPESHPALLDLRVRRAALSAARLGLGAACREDRSDGAAPSCPKCGERMRQSDWERPLVETALGPVRLPMTPSARRMASLAGSSCRTPAEARLVAWRSAWAARRPLRRTLAQPRHAPRAHRGESAARTGSAGGTSRHRATGVSGCM